MEQKSVNSSAPNPFSASGTAATDLASHSGKAKMSCKAELRMDEPQRDRQRRGPVQLAGLFDRVLLHFVRFKDDRYLNAVFPIAPDAPRGHWGGRPKCHNLV